MGKKVPLSRILQALDCKERQFYENLSDEEKKSIGFVPLLRYASSISSNDKMAEQYHLLATNRHANIRFFDISAKNHSQLMWLLLTTVSLDIGTQYHKWIKFKKESGNKKEKVIALMYPEMKESDIELLASLYTDQDELINDALDFGFDEKEVKKLLK